MLGWEHVQLWRGRCAAAAGAGMPSEARRDGSATMGGRLDEGVAGPELPVSRGRVRRVDVVDPLGTSSGRSLR